MGLKPSTYWTANYIHDYIVYLAVVAVLIIAGVAFRMILFVHFKCVKHSILLKPLTRAWR